MKFKMAATAELSLTLDPNIVASLADLGHEVEKRNINLSEAIHHIGEYDVNITLHSNINITVKVIVKPQKVSNKKQPAITS